MEIRDFLSPADIMIDVRASDKTRLLQQLSAQAANALGLDSDDVSEQITKREELGSTGVGNGVGLPHARLPGLKAPFGLLARLRHGIDFEAIDGQPVDVVFLLLLPETGDGAQLNALASVARALRARRTRYGASGGPVTVKRCTAPLLSPARSLSARNGKHNRAALENPGESNLARSGARLGEATCSKREPGDEADAASLTIIQHVFTAAIDEIVAVLHGSHVEHLRGGFDVFHGNVA
jgi:nitrogen PTS system EIIA component